MTVSLGQSVTFAIGNEDSDGAPANASSIAGTLYRNGASTGTTVTLTNLATGVYSIAFTVPSGYADGDLLQVRIVADGIGRFVWGDTIAALVGSTGTYAKIPRYRSDQTVMTFAWPVTGATITATRSVDNSSYVSASGTVSFVRTESGKHYYALSYHASDRPAGESVVRFKLTDGTYTQYLIVDVVEDEGSSSGSGTGTGARTVTITINDGSTVLQNARVRLTEGANTYTGMTNASGVVVFNVDDASYTVSITKSGYSFAGTTLVVDGTETQTYSMMATLITPGGDAGEVTGYFTVRDEVNNAESGVTIYCRMLGIDDSSTGDAHDGANRTEVSAGNGLVQFEGLLIGGTYEFWRAADSAARKVTIPDTTETQAGTYALPDIIGGN